MHFLKRVLDRKFHISYPNRNEYIRTLFDTAAAIKDMSDYTIFKFDFSDFLILSPVNMFITSISRVLHLNDTKTS